MKIQHILTALIIASVPPTALGGELRPSETIDTERLARLLGEYNRDAEQAVPFRIPKATYPDIAGTFVLPKLVSGIIEKSTAVGCGLEVAESAGYSVSFKAKGPCGHFLEITIAPYRNFTDWATLEVRSKDDKSGTVIVPLVPSDASPQEERRVAEKAAREFFAVDPLWWQTTNRTFKAEIQSLEQSDREALTGEIAKEYFNAAVEEKNFDVLLYDSLFGLSRAD